MSADIRELIEQIRGGLDACTSGPWSLGVGAKGELFLTRIYGPYDDERISGEFPKDEDAEHAALCDPQAIRRLLDHIAELEARTIPDGWVAVPRNPYPEMLGAWYRYKSGFHFHDEPPPPDTSDVGAYAAMLAALPSSPKGGQDNG